jgi:hypothetical protein
MLLLKIYFILFYLKMSIERNFEFLILFINEIHLQFPLFLLINTSGVKGVT